MDDTLQAFQNWVITNTLYYSLFVMNKVTDFFETWKEFGRKTWQGARDAHLDRWYLFMDRNTYPIITKGELFEPRGCKNIYCVRTNTVLGPRMPREFEDVVLAQLKNIETHETYDMSSFFSTLKLQSSISLLEIVLLFCLQEGIFLPLDTLKQKYRLEILNSEAETLVNVLEEENFTLWPILKEEGELVEDLPTPRTDA